MAAAVAAAAKAEATAAGMPSAAHGGRTARPDERDVPLALQLNLSESEVGSAVASAETTARDDSDDNDDSAAPNVRARAAGQKWHARAHEMALEDAAAAAAMAAEAALGGAAAAVGAANAADVAVKTARVGRGQ